MDKTSRRSVSRTVRAAVFIILVVVFCTAMSSAGIYLASKFGLAQFREQVPLTVLYLGNEREVKFSGHGKMVGGNGWGLRNSRNSYMLTLDDAVIGNAAKKNAVEKDTPEGNTVMESMEFPRPEIDITGDLAIKLREGSSSWIRSEGVGIRIRPGTLVIRGKGNLDIRAGTADISGNRTGNSQAALCPKGGQLGIKGACAGASCSEVDIVGGTGAALASGQSGVGLYSCRLRVEESEGEITTEGSCAVVLAGGSGKMKPFIKVDEKAAAKPGSARTVGPDAVRLENVIGHEEETKGWMEGAHSLLLTRSLEDMVTYNEDTFCFDDSAKTIRFAAK